MQETGFKGSLQDFFKFMREDKRFYYPNTAAGKQMYLDESKKAQDMVQAAVNEAIRSAQELAASKMNAAAGGLAGPGGLGGLGLPGF